MWNPMQWLWRMWHGEDKPVIDEPQPPTEKWPLITINYELRIAGQEVETPANETADEFADLGKLPIQVDSLL